MTSIINRIGNLATKEIIQIVRDRLLLIFIVVTPMLELVLLARSTGQGIRDQPAVIVDQDRSQTSRQLVAAVDNTDELVVVAYLDSLDQTETWLERNRAALVIVLPPGLEADLMAARSPQVQLIADASNSVVGSNVLSAASGAINAFVARRAIESTGEDLPLVLRSQLRYNPTLNIRYFTVTAQLGFIVYQVTLMVASLGLARERELGTLEQLLVTPLQRFELITGKAIPALIVAGANFVLMLAIAVWGFGVPMRGSYAVLLGLSLLFIAAETGWGLVISSASHTQQQAVLLIFVLAMVDMAFSGYLVPVERLPAALQALSGLFPLRHYLVILRRVMLKGAPLPALWGEALALVALGLASSTVAMIGLRRQLD